MSSVHHLDDATLLSFAAGGLERPLAIVAGTHLGACAACRARLLEADRVGGALLQVPAPVVPSAQARAAMLARLDDDEPLPAATPTVAVAHDPDLLPASVQPYFGRTYSGLRWRTLAPGVQRIRAHGIAGGQLFLLRIAAGKKLPVHSHQGNELTLVLKGAYDDVLGHFGPGDIADLDGDTEHQPITAPGEPCVCLAATDAPLRFSGAVARALQPLFGL